MKDQERKSRRTLKAIRKEKIQHIRKRIGAYSAKFEDGIIDIKISSGPIDRRKVLDAITRLESDTMYISSHQQLTIRVEFEDKLEDDNKISTLKEAINSEIIKIIYHENQEIKRIKLISLILGIVGITSMSIAALLSNDKFITFAIQQLFVIISWVFIWETIDKMVFVRQQLVSKKLKLYQLYFADYESID